MNAGCAIALRCLAGRLGLLLVALVLAAYVGLALAPFRWVPPRRAPNAAVNGAAGLTFAEPGLARTRQAPAWLARAAELGTLHLHLRLRTYAPGQPRLARIVTVSRDYHFRNLTLDQGGFDLVLRLRQPGSTQNGKPSYRLAGVLGDTAWHDVEIAIAPGSLRVVVDGAVVLSRVLAERPLESWDRHYPLVLGNEVNGGRPWRGALARAVVEVGGERIDYASPGMLEIPAQFWAFANRPTWLFEDYVFPDSIADWAANFASFIPLGFLLAALGGARGSRRRTVVVCAAISLLVEVAQGFFSRHPSTTDWVLNTLGGGTGAAMARWLADRVLPARQGAP